jgi:hypothetical protein
MLNLCCLDESGSPDLEINVQSQGSRPGAPTCAAVQKGKGTSCPFGYLSSNWSQSFRLPEDSHSHFPSKSTSNFQALAWWQITSS